EVALELVKRVRGRHVTARVDPAAGQVAGALQARGRERQEHRRTARARLDDRLSLLHDGVGREPDHVAPLATERLLLGDAGQLDGSSVPDRDATGAVRREDALADRLEQDAQPLALATHV